MRYFLLGCLLAAVMPAFSYNETVAAISYNPSRMGAYTHLKVARKAILKGGLIVEEPAAGEDYNLVFLSKNGVTLRDGSDTTLTNRCSDAAACTRDNQNEITTIKPERYNASNVCTDGTCVTEVEAISVMVQAISTEPLETYSYTSESIHTAGKRLDTLAVYGGTFVAQAGGSQDSYIATIPNNGGDNGTVANLKLKANQMLEVGGLYISESLQLGNVTISEFVPSSEYAFVDRVFNNGAKKVSVLAVK